MEAAEGAGRIALPEVGPNPLQELDELRVGAEVGPEPGNDAMVVGPEGTRVARARPLAPRRVVQLADPCVHGRSVAAGARAGIRSCAAPWFGLLPSGHRSPMRDDDACTPAGRPPSRRRADRLGIEAAAGEQPRDHRVGVPHLPGAELVAPPNRRRRERHEIKDALSELRVIREPLRALDGLGDVGDDAAGPAAELVAEDAEAPCPASADRPAGDGPTLLAVPAQNWSRLDHESAFRHPDHERRVVEVARRATLEPRGESLEDLSVQAYGLAAGAERQPVQINA